MVNGAMETPFPRRVTELRPVGHSAGDPPRRVTTNQPSKLFAIAENELNPWELKSSGTTSPDSSSSKGSSHGRPGTKLDNSTERGILRLFVGAPNSLEQIIEAIGEYGGPARQWLRERLQTITGAEGRGGLSLARIRLPNGKRKTKEHSHRETARICTKYQALLPDKLADAGREANKTGSRDECFAASTNDEDSGSLRHECDPRHHASWLSLGASSVEENYSKSTTEDNLRSQEPVRKKRESTETEGTSSSRQTPSAAKRLRVSKSPSLTDVALRLDGGKPGLCYHLAKCCSISKTTVASNLSSTFTLSKNRTLASEFHLFYAPPQRGDLKAASSVLGEYRSCRAAGQPVGHLKHEPVVVYALIDARRSGLDDKHVKEGLKLLLPADEQARRAFVNVADKRGVTGLHLSVAYGFPEACGLLLLSGADHKATTERGTRINHFAKSAEKQAAQDNALYFRIWHCKNFVKNGREPPAPDRAAQTKHLGERRLKQSRRRRPGERLTGLFAPTDDGETTMRRADEDTESSTASLGFSFGSRTHTGPASGSVPYYASQLTDSPKLPSMQRAFSMTDSFDFAASHIVHSPDLDPRLQGLAMQSDPTLAYPTYPFTSAVAGPAVLATDGGTVCPPLYAPMATTDGNSLTFFNPLHGHMGPSVDWQSMQNNFDFLAASVPSSGVVSTQVPRDAMLSDTSSYYTPIVTNDAQLNQDGRHFPGGSQPQASFVQQAKDYPRESHNSFHIDHEPLHLNMANPVHPEAPTLAWRNCPHRYPRNYEQSFCMFGCTKLGLLSDNAM